MPFEMVRNDITRMRVDAIVNAANPSLLGGGGVDGAIHRAAGPELLAECRTLGGCRTGEAKITRGYDLPAKYVIHTVGPIWQGGQYGERALLASCYRNSLALARDHGCESVAFPLISAGVYGYPKDEAISVAVDEIRRFLADDDMTVYLVLFGQTEFLAGKTLFREVQEYIDRVYAEKRVDARIEHMRESLWHSDESAAAKFDQQLMSDAFDGYAAPINAPRSDDEPFSDLYHEAASAPPCEDVLEPAAKSKRPSWFKKGRKSVVEAVHPTAAMPDWKELLRKTDEGFSTALMRLIDKKGMTDAECYKRANIDRKLFSKIRSNPEYKPSKPTVFAFAIALKLTLPETKDLLRKAGFALSYSSRFDIILEYFIINRRFDVFEINEVLFQFDLPLLGSVMN